MGAPENQEVILAAEQRRRMAAEHTARREIIDYIAASIAFQKGRTWNRMTVARREQMRAQARAALMAVRRLPFALDDAVSHVAVAAADFVNDGVDATTVARHVEAYLAEVLR